MEKYILHILNEGLTPQQAMAVRGGSNDPCTCNSGATFACDSNKGKNKNCQCNGGEKFDCNSNTKTK